MLCGNGMLISRAVLANTPHEFDWRLAPYETISVPRSTMRSRPAG